MSNYLSRHDNYKEDFSNARWVRFVENHIEEWLESA